MTAEAFAEPLALEGVLDRLRNIRELFKLANSGIIAELISLASRIPNREWGEALVDVADILRIQGLPVEADAVRNLGTALTPRPFNWRAIGIAECDLQKVLVMRFVPEPGVASDGPIRMGEVGARQDVSRMSREDFKKWLADNASQVKDGRENRIIRRILSRRAPEVLDALDGKPVAMELTPEQATKIIKALDIAIFAATLAGMFLPGALAISTVLRGVQVYLKSRFPEIKELPDFTPDGIERGIALEDLVSILAA